MSKVSIIVAAIARIPVNFITKVGEDIKTLNEQAANKPEELSEEDLAEARALLAAKKARNSGHGK